MKLYGLDFYPKNFKFANNPKLVEVYNYAKACHEGTNQTYDDKPYFDTHILMVFHYALKYIHLVPEKWQLTILFAALCHDLIEDCRVTYNDLVTLIGKEAAEIVFACTNNRGRTREERANAEYYTVINKTPGAEYVKVCDRLANASSSRDAGHDMLKKYKKEQPHFRESVQRDYTYAELWHELRSIIYTPDEIIDLTIENGDMIQHVEAGPPIVIIKIYCHFDKHQQPYDKYPVTKFVGATVDDIIDSHKKGIAAPMTVLSSHEVQMYV